MAPFVRRLFLWSRTKSLFAWFLVYSFLSVCLYLSDWVPIRISGWATSGYPGDLRMTLGFVDCVPKYGLRIYETSTPDPSCGSVGYGYFFLKLLSLIGIGSQHLSIIALILSLMFVLVLTFNSFNIGPLSNIHPILILLLFFSPVVWMLLSHLNIDILLYALIGLALRLESKGKSLYSILLIFITSLIKFFTLPFMYLLVARFMLLRKTNLFARIIAFSLVVLSTLNAFFDMRRIQWNNSMFAEGIFGVFGVISSSNWIELLCQKFLSQEIVFTEAFKYLLAYCIFLFALISSYIFAFKFSKTNKRFQKQFAFDSNLVAHPSRLYLLYFGIPFLSLYFSDLNYDQKLIFLGLALTPTMGLLTQNSRYVLFCFLFSSLWFTLFYPKTFSQTIYNWIQLIGDLSLGVVTVFLIHLVTKVVLSEFSSKLKSY